jgi:hypothetical protein
MKLYSLLITILITLVCCEPQEEISWKVDEIPERLVVEGSITNELKLHTVTLKKSGNYFSNTAAEVVSDAVVTITDGSNIFYFEESPMGSGIYKTTEEVKGDTGKLYTLNIDTNEPLNNETHFSANSFLKRTVRTDSMISILYDSPFVFDPNDTVILVNNVFGYEPEPAGDYYILSLYRNGMLLNDTIDEYITIYDRNSGINGAKFFPFAFLENFAVSDTVEIEFRSISKAYYDFIDGVKRISGGTDPFGFSGPPANPVGNIEGGEALGFFIASAVTRVKARVREAAWEQLPNP